MTLPLKSDSLAAKIKSLGYELPAAAAPAAAYVPTVFQNGLLYISGQLPIMEGTLKFAGKLGADVEVAQGQEAARLCALNILAHVNQAIEGDIAKVLRCVRLGGWVNSVDTFTHQPHVINGASELMLAVFGEAGKHVRAAVGTNSLPFGAAVEVEALFAIVE